MSDGGKGDKRIPAQVSQEQVTLNWSNVFGKSKLEQRLEAEQKAKEELEQAVLEGLASLSDPIPISELPELQNVVRIGLENGTIVPS